MASEDKKYSLISVDTGVAEEEAGVRTTREVVGGEETIVVSSSASCDEATSDDVLNTAAKVETAGVPERLDHTSRFADDGAPADAQASSQVDRDDGDDDDKIPFQRMQGIIIVCLIVLIVAFLVYFNFVR